MVIQSALKRRSASPKFYSMSIIANLVEYEELATAYI